MILLTSWKCIYSATGGNNDTDLGKSRVPKIIRSISLQNKMLVKRFDLLKQAEAIFMEEMSVIPIYFYTNNWVQVRKLKRCCCIRTW